MTLDRRIDDGRREVWYAFADHFLDTETRHDLPRAALVAVEAGFSIEEAREIWRHEVTPAVGFNLWQVAGEWAGWDRDWLAATITEGLRVRRRPPALVAHLGYRLTIHFGHGSWIAIERFMRALLAVEPSARRAVARDLCLLARHYFDFGPRALDLRTPGRRDELQRLYAEVLLPAVSQTLPWGAREAAACARRVEEALR